MSVAHRFTWLFGLHSLTELKACSPLALYHCALIKQMHKTCLRTGKKNALEIECTKHLNALPIENKSAMQIKCK